MICPICGSGCNRSVSGAVHFFRCRSCGTIFNSEHKTIPYSDSYFTEYYSKQYGRTYEEDFDGIYRSSLRRVERVMSLWNLYHQVSPYSVLDIGCALGFFLRAAQDQGFAKTDGIEVSGYASERCRQRFGYHVIESDFEHAEIGHKYDVVTAWYFIEHCSDTASVLKKIYSLINDGGVFAFSAPSSFGPAFMFNRKGWSDTHPVDHRIDISPYSIVKILKSAGFRKVKVYPAGFHPERIMSENNLVFPIFKWLYKLFSNKTAFSDTIEVYAIK